MEVVWGAKVETLHNYLLNVTKLKRFDENVLNAQCMITELCLSRKN